MDLREQYRKICQSVDNVETLYDLPCIEVERNFLILMSLYDQAADYEEDSYVMGEWISAMDSNVEVAFYKRELFSQEFIAYYEVWYAQDDRLGRIHMGSKINDYCISEIVYKIIKQKREKFAELYWGDPSIDLWESAVYLFERYDRKPFSLERYNSIHG